jgi:hypothetical protein
VHLALVSALRCRLAVHRDRLLPALGGRGHRDRECDTGRRLELVLAVPVHPRDRGRHFGHKARGDLAFRSDRGNVLGVREDRRREFCLVRGSLLRPSPASPFMSESRPQRAPGPLWKRDSKRASVNSTPCERVWERENAARREWSRLRHLPRALRAKSP